MSILCLNDLLEMLLRGNGRGRHLLHLRTVNAPEAELHGHVRTVARVASSALRCKRVGTDLHAATSRCTSCAGRRCGPHPAARRLPAARCLRCRVVAPACPTESPGIDAAALQLHVGPARPPAPRSLPAEGITTPEVVASYRADLSATGLGDASTRKAMFLLRGVPGLAVLYGAIAYNPVKAIRSRARSRARCDRWRPPDGGGDPAAAVGQTRLVLVLAYAACVPTKPSSCAGQASAGRLDLAL